MGTYDMRKMSNAYLANALLGTWAKTARGVYTRSTGEVVRKVNFAWETDAGRFTGLSHAMGHVDAKYRS